MASTSSNVAASSENTNSQQLATSNTADHFFVARKTAGLTPAQLKYVPEGLEGSALAYKIVDEEELLSVYGWLVDIPVDNSWITSGNEWNWLTFNQIAPKWIKGSKWVKRWNEDLIDWLDLRVTKEDLDDAVEYLDIFGETRPGMELNDPYFIWTREYKFPHAVWAVGRGLLAALLPNFVSVDQIWLDPTSWEGIAFTRISKNLEGGYEETGTQTRSFCEKELVLCFGPYVASRMLTPFGENNNLSKLELDNAKEIAARMVMEYGWASDDSPMIYQTDGAQIALAMGDTHELELEAKMEKLFYNACGKAVSLLEQNRPAMDAMLEHLLENDVLEKEELNQILKKYGAVFEEEPFNLVPYTHMEMMGGALQNGTGRVGISLPAGTYT